MGKPPHRAARLSLTAALLCVFSCGSYRGSDEPVQVAPVVVTDATDVADDPAIWVNPGDPAQSLILGVNKVAAPAGALLVYALNGRTIQKIDGLDRPNNVDVDYGLPLRGVPTDFAVLTERYQHRLRVFAIDARTRNLTDVSSPEALRVFDGESGERAAPMGIAVYHRPSDGALFAIVSRKEGPSAGYLWEYRLADDGSGHVAATKVREFGNFSGKGEIEAIAVDDPLGYVYYADEGEGVHKWYADPDNPDAGRELAVFGQEGFRGKREGLAIYARPDGTGYIICTDQVAGDSAYHLYRREGSTDNPHDHSERVATISGGADGTDGIEATSAAMPPRFPQGALIVMNSIGHNFLAFTWEDIAERMPQD